MVYPPDLISTKKATLLAANTNGLFYVRKSRFSARLWYLMWNLRHSSEEKFEIVKSKIVRDNLKILSWL